jgi:hypothetical protein
VVRRVAETATEQEGGTDAGQLRRDALAGIEALEGLKMADPQI